MSVPMGMRRLCIVARSGLGEPACFAAALAAAAFLAALDEEEAPVSVTKTSTQRSIAPAGALPPRERGESEKSSTSLGYSSAAGASEMRSAAKEAASTSMTSSASMTGSSESERSPV